MREALSAASPQLSVADECEEDDAGGAEAMHQASCFFLGTVSVVTKCVTHVLQLEQFVQQQQVAIMVRYASLLPFEPIF
jgi:hypothetical protein